MEKIMKGIVFILLNQFIDQALGEDAWDTLLDIVEPDSGGAYTAVATYPDEELFSLVTTACEKHQLDFKDTVKAFGNFMFPPLAEKYPNFIKKDMKLKDFLLSINDVIHVEVRKLYPEAGLPDIQYEETEDNLLTIIYDSPRKLCFLAEGLIEGAAQHFEESIKVSQSDCMHQGSQVCKIHINFE